MPSAKHLRKQKKRQRKQKKVNDSRCEYEKWFMKKFFLELDDDEIHVMIDAFASRLKTLQAQASSKQTECAWDEETNFTLNYLTLRNLYGLCLRQQHEIGEVFEEVKFTDEAQAAYDDLFCSIPPDVMQMINKMHNTPRTKVPGGYCWDTCKLEWRQ